ADRVAPLRVARRGHGGARDDDARARERLHREGVEHHARQHRGGLSGGRGGGGGGARARLRGERGRERDQRGEGGEAKPEAPSRRVGGSVSRGATVGARRFIPSAARKVRVVRAPRRPHISLVITALGAAVRRQVERLGTVGEFVADSARAISESRTWTANA